LINIQVKLDAVFDKKNLYDLYIHILISYKLTKVLLNRYKKRRLTPPSKYLALHVNLYKFIWNIMYRNTTTYK